MVSPKPSDHTPNVFAYRHHHLLQKYNVLHEHFRPPKLQHLTATIRKRDAPDLPVCIIGAGAAGLYAAMIFESLGINYQIIEANKKERLGGRISTYRFPGGGPNDYFDLGAMRFVDTPFMKRTIDLIENRGLKGLERIPYVKEMVDPPNTWLYFNGARVNNQDKRVTGDPFNIGGYVTDESLRTQGGVLSKIAEAIQPFRDLFRSLPNQQPPDVVASVKILFEQTNRLSLRHWMLINKGMDPKDVNWCQILGDVDGAYDLSLTQFVIDSLALDWPTTPLPYPEDPKDPNDGWYSLGRGFGTLPWAMFNSLSADSQTSTLFESPVTAISREVRRGQDRNVVEVMKISIRGNERPREYSAIISTVSLPCLGLVDLSEAGIHESYAQWSAIRALSYGSALKIGMKFTSAWWGDLPKPIHGGESFTDLTIHNIRYPSHPEDATKETRSKVLMVSFVRLQDCERLAAFINSDGTAKPGLLEVIFRDLAAVHGVDVDYIKNYYEDKEENFFAWDWTQDPSAVGYAYFGPGVYGDGDLYGALLEPAAGGKLFIAGEAASAAHGWIAGSLDSAWRAVWQYLTIHRPDKLCDFYGLWGRTEYWDENSDDRLVESYHTLMTRHLAIALQKDGVTVELKSRL